MEAFIVRIYRRTPDSMPDVTGTVERIGSGDRSGFAGRQQLLDQLLKSGSASHSEPEPDRVGDGNQDPGST